MALWKKKKKKDRDIFHNKMEANFNKDVWTINVQFPFPQQKDSCAVH